MGTAFADFCAEQDARNTVQLNVVKYCYMLCDALRQNYIDYSIKMHQSAIVSLDRTYGTSEGNHAEYHHRQIDRLKSGDCDYEFYIETGNKYHKIIMSASGSRSVHAFVDKKTGEVYKSASWKSPAKGVRYDLRLIKDREWLLENADWSGGYLYVR